MENASKALFIAAGVLIGMLIISLAIYLFVSFGSTSAEIHKQNKEQQIAQFNNQFISYEVKECTIYDVITVANLATENNVYYELIKEKRKTEGEDNYISVYLNMKAIEGGYGDADMTNTYNELIFQNVDESGTVSQYKCKVDISKVTQRVFRILFTKKT